MIFAGLVMNGQWVLVALSTFFNVDFITELCDYKKRLWLYCNVIIFNSALREFYSLSGWTCENMNLAEVPPPGCSNAFLNIINVFSPCIIAYLTIPHGLVHCTGVCVLRVHLFCIYQNVLSLQKPGKKVLQYCVCVQLEVMHKSVQKKASFMAWSLFFNRNTLGQAQWVAEVWRYTLHV